MAAFAALLGDGRTRIGHTVVRAALVSFELFGVALQTFRLAHVALSLGAGAGHNLGGDRCGFLALGRRRRFGRGTDQRGCHGHDPQGKSQAQPRSGVQLRHASVHQAPRPNPSRLARRWATTVPHRTRTNDHNRGICEKNLLASREGANYSTPSGRNRAYLEHARNLSNHFFIIDIMVAQCSPIAARSSRRTLMTSAIAATFTSPVELLT